MNLRSLSLKTIAAGLVLAVGIPAMAMAANPFDDVLDGQWYSEPVDWAYNEGITTGKTPTTFNGWDETNRYEVVTFVHRYHENIIEPAAAETDAEVAALEAELASLESSLASIPTVHWASVDADGDLRRASSGVNQDTSETQRLGVGAYEVDFDVDNVGNCQIITSIGSTVDFVTEARMITGLLRTGDESSVWIGVYDENGDGIDAEFEVQLSCGRSSFTPPLTMLSDGDEVIENG
ncbi:MAG: S-layer homology domain-containing protein [Actinomycetota bacterium]